MATRILIGDALEQMRCIAEGSVHAIITSPPYYGLRDYGVEGQIGLEETPEAFIARLCGVFDEARRVLRVDGTLWVVIGDSYGPAKSLLGIPWRFAFAMQDQGWILRQDIIWAKNNPMPESVHDRCTKSHEHVFMFTRSAKYFYDSENNREPSVSTHGSGNGFKCPSRRSIGGRGSDTPWEPTMTGRNRRDVWAVNATPFKGAHFATFPPKLIEPIVRVATSDHGCCAACGAPYRRIIEKGAPDLTHQRACGGDVTGAYRGRATKDYAAGGAQDASAVKARILAGMVERRTVGWRTLCTCEAPVVSCLILDPFGGAGTTALVARDAGRDCILIELNPDYVRLAEERLNERR